MKEKNSGAMPFTVAFSYFGETILHEKGRSLKRTPVAVTFVDGEQELELQISSHVKKIVPVLQNFALPIEEEMMSFTKVFISKRGCTGCI